MKNNRKILAAAVGAICLGSLSPVMAQQATFEETTAIAPNAGNALEREYAPALREQARKKIILENKKMDLEIEKSDYDLLKIQQEVLALTNPMASFNAASISGVVGQVPNGVPQGLPNNIPQQPMPNLPEMSQGSGVNYDDGVRVLMTIGSEDDWKAKIMYHLQGGYLVSVGDTLPNGKIVTKITGQFIEAKEKGEKKATRFPVMGYPNEEDLKIENDRKKSGKSSNQEVGLSEFFGIPMKKQDVLINGGLVGSPTRK